VNTEQQETLSFDGLDLQPETARALEKMGFHTPTPIQMKAIPAVRDGYDVIAKAPTGTGKTCAFGIPVLECLDLECADVQAVVVCPTRELCLQITDDLRRLAAFRPGVHIVPVYGGQSMNTQINALKKKPQIVVATPGRLLDLMGRRVLWLGNVYTVVLDEADEMLKMGFIRDVRKILHATPADTQVVMFSATISRDVEDVAWEYQRNAVQIEVESKGENRPAIQQYALRSSGSQRLSDMLKIMTAMDLRRVMVFCNRKSTVRQVCSQLKRQGKSADCLHGDISQGQRNQVMTGYRKGKFEILVATDVAARGIDVDDVEAVFNYDIPEENEYYLHRIGRTGRAKRHGIAITFWSLGDEFRMRDIRRRTHSDIADITLNEAGAFVPVETEEDE